MSKKKVDRFAVCLDNRDYEVSLELHKVYAVVRDEKGARLGMLRIIDESGEDYLFEEDRFILIPVPTVLAKAILERTA